MINPLSFYVDKIINDLKEKGKQSKQKGWSMSDIVQEVENQLGKDANELARKRIIAEFFTNSNQEGEYERLSPEEWYENQRLFPNK